MRFEIAGRGIIKYYNIILHNCVKKRKKIHESLLLYYHPVILDVQKTKNFMPSFLSQVSPAFVGVDDSSVFHPAEIRGLFPYDDGWGHGHC